MRPFDRVLRQLTLANQLTLLRLIAVPLVALTLLSGANRLALAIFVLAAITDRLDGIAARRLGQQTTLGRFLDPAADKALMLVVFVILAMPDGPRPFPEFQIEHHVPAWLTLLVVARDLLIVLVATLVYLSYRITSFPPSLLGKGTTALELVTAGLYMFANAWSVLPVPLLVAACGLTTVFIVASGIHYAVGLRRLIVLQHPPEDRT